MSNIALTDMTLELSNSDDEVPKGITHIILEFSLNGNIIQKVNLLSRDSISEMRDVNKTHQSPTGFWVRPQHLLFGNSKGNQRSLGDAFPEGSSAGSIVFPKGSIAKGCTIWSTDEKPRLSGLAGELEISAWIEINDDGRQLLGCTKLSGRDLYELIGKRMEANMMGHKSYPSLVLKTRIVDVGNIRESTPSVGRWITRLYEKHTANKLLSDSNTALDDFEQHGSLARLEQAISKLEAATKAIPEDNPVLPDLLNILGTCLTRRFERIGRLADIDDAVARFEVAVILIPDYHPDKLGYLSNLGICLQTRFERLKNISDLDEAISCNQKAVDLTPNDHSEKPRFLNNLGISFQARFNWHGNIGDLNEAISRIQEAVDLTPNDHIEKPRYLNDLGISLTAHFERVGNIDSLNEAISRQQQAVSLTSNDHPEKSRYLNNLGASLRTRYERLRNIADLNEAISRQQNAVGLAPDDHPDKPNYLNNLGNSLHDRFKQIGSINDLDEAISRQQEAIGLTPNDHPRKPVCLNNLGNSLLTRFRRLGNLADIDETISQLQEAVTLTPKDHPNKPMFLNSLGSALQNRFERLGSISDIDEAISREHQAVSLTSEDHPNRPDYLHNLGATLRTRFERLRNITDLNEAILQQQSAVDLAPNDHPNKRSYLNSLGNALHERFDQTESTNDLNNAISQQQEAVSLTPDDHPYKPDYLSNLGNSLRARYERLGLVGDLVTAISQQRKAVTLTPNDHPRKPVYLNNLGRSLQDRFKWAGNIAHIDDAIVQHQAAVNLTSEGHYNRTNHLFCLSVAYWTRFYAFKRLNDAEAAISSSSAAAKLPIGDPPVRLAAANIWIELASRIRHHSLLSAYECAIGLIPVVAWLGLSIQGRHQHLIKMGVMARDAAAAAISDKQYGKALEWLEQGRSVVWTQILQLRTPIDKLHDIKPGLSNRLLQVSRLIDQRSEPDELAEGNAQSIEEEGRKYRALTAEWESIIEQVRSLPEFEDFLRPIRSSRLMSAAQGGPVVILNIARERCDALAIIPGLHEVKHIPLSNITFDRVTELRDELKDLLSSTGVRMRGERAAQKAEEETDEESCRHILAELWNRLIKPVLDGLEFSPHPDTLPRIWWYATGPLAFLPIHAAGIYDLDSTDAQLGNYAISSYTPTLSALLKSPNLAPDYPFSLLSVIQPSAPGAASILNTKEELKKIQYHLTGRTHVVIEGPEGIKRRVLRAMEDSNWLHLACHGVQKPDDPTKSALILEDGHLSLEEIIKLNLPKAEFAFLSACQTTTGDEKLSEEAVHIAGGMLLAGYRGVVATMWSIKDELAPEVTDEFYGHIMRPGERPDSRRAAEALHFAVQKLRKKPDVSLSDWIPFVHLGV